MRFLLPLIGYLSFGTVLTAALGYGYLRKTERLDDEQVFKIVALLHDVDLEAMEHEGERPQSVVPEEEPSLEQQQEQLRLATLNFDAKQRELKDSLAQFDHDFKKLDNAMGRYNQLSQEVETYLQQERDALMTAAIQRTRASIEMLIAKKQAKPIIARMIQQGEIDQVIKILDGMSKRNQQEILRTFVGTKEDEDILYKITQKMLSGGQTRQLIDEKLNDLSKLKQNAN